MARDPYAAQVALLVRILPLVAKEEIFALKGGTAINLFYRDLPRLSVDIDLTYLPIKDRTESLAEINAAMDRLVNSIEEGIAGARARRIEGGGGGATRLAARLGAAEIKIETSPVTRGVIHSPKLMTVSDAVQAEFGFAETQVVSFEDLYGGKLHAALDRQHPRDLFDVKLLYENEALTDALFRALLIYVASSPRPAHELLNPNFADLEQHYAQEFLGMTKDPVSLDELVAVRARLVDEIRARLDDDAQAFLLGLHNAEPNFDAIGLPQAADLPAVKWKLLNLRKLIENNPAKHDEQRAELLTLWTQ
ncbi:nucleotidyl transferase AbiEii/AbiGii toxin family protein [Yoonia sp. GPGPB17]|uniref:nucleotidyl transferase AbiEii/AbiGii toxin family protein n=1 Tax=Yoonia sp. GPGPB17 TaxID=3026147 RepID=UPI0030C588AF